MAERPRFRVGYAGETSYTYKGREYNIQTHSMGTDFSWNEGVLEYKKQLVGTLRNGNSDQFHQYPPDEVIAFFPGYIPMRWTADWKPEYLGGVPPAVMPDKCCPGGIEAVVWREQRDAWDAFSNELHKLIDKFSHYSEYQSFRDRIEWDAAVPTDRDRQRVADALNA